MISPSLKNHLVEILSSTFHTKQIDEIGNLIFTSYSSNKLSGTPAHISIKERISLRIALDAGRLRFFTDTGKIVSEVINYAAHLEKKGTEAGKISISRALHDALPETIFDLFKPAGVFEDRDYFSLPNRFFSG